ncbi:hypothetical protein [Lentibacillus juripiscarius]|uniref:HlyD family secretion protein n=1 Tax=Lentibacillus juripiscarius TaxID=257446 RepID=A0ABW5V615_9BACI
MKRYWRLIAIVTVVVLTVGTFYIQSTLSASSYPEVVFEKMSGNEEELEPVVLNGHYSTSSRGMGEGVRVTAEGSNYTGEQSFFERLQRGFYSQGIKQLQDKYRGFMRGKGGNIASYFETENTLAYAEVINQFIGSSASDMEFDIAVLDKESDETTSFTVPVPNRAMYNHAYIEDVQMVDGNLKVISQMYPKNGRGAKYVYSFDISKQEINGEEKIAAVENQNENTRVKIRILSSSDIKAAHNCVIYEKTEEPIIRDPERNQTSVTEKPANKGEKEYVVYNLETGEKKSMKLPEELAGADAIMYKNATLYLQNENQLTLYNVKTEEVGSQTELPSQDTAKQREAHSVLKIANGTMYVLATPVGMDQENPQTITIIDTKSGDVLYKGKIMTKKPLNEGKSLYFSGMQIK